jgi:two-component flavin-dependent monooxygenase
MTSTLVARTQDVAEIATKHSADMEMGRRLAGEVVAAVVNAGFARHFVPARWGGDDGDFGSQLDAVALLGEHCPATSWFASLTTGLSRMAAYLPAEGQAALWADGPDPIIVGALMPIGKAELAGTDGWLLRGRWPYVSGIEFSEWALVCAMAARAEGGPEARFFLVPRAVYGAVDTWFNVGMRGTGSNTLVLDEVFVPAEHTFSREEIMIGAAAGSGATAHQAPLRAVNGLGFAAPLLGAGRGALRSWVTLATEKKYAGQEHQQITAARASGEVDAAALLLGRVAAIADRGDVTAEETMRSWRDCALAVDLLVTAVDRLFRSAGTSAQADTQPLQRFWRDVNAAASHVVLRFEPAAVAYCEHLLRTA